MMNKFSMKSVMMIAMTVLLGLAAQARTFEFKQFKSTGSQANSEYYWMGTEKSKSAWYRIKIGGASKIDDTSEMEIRAATVLKNIKDRKTGVNDIAKFKFDPINRGKAIYFMVSSGVAVSLERDKYWYGNDGRADRGWQLAGCIIEIWQKGKVVKHWSGAGNAGKTRLADGIPLLQINKDGYASKGDRNRFDRDFDNATEIFSVDVKGERVDIDDVLQPYRESEDDSEAESERKSAKKDDSADEAPVKNVVAQKLRQCDFLLNEKFKKKAKFYLCLFSASWCPPCRAEMPRIAKTYAETLKDDPDIELIHFSRDQDDEKAMAWAKEHDVKFPVVRPRGGNPLDLHSRGIPHLFIVKADGTVLEEGHPMRIFNEEKFREIKGETPTTREKSRVVDNDVGTKEEKETIDGYTWSYSIVNGAASIEAAGGKHGLAVSPRPEGSIVIPAKLGGLNVTRIRNGAFFSAGLEAVTLPPELLEIGRSAFYQCRMESVSLPPHVKSIGDFAFGHCSRLSSVMLSQELTHIGPMAFYGCRELVSMRIPSSVTSIGNEAFGCCESLTSIEVEGGNREFATCGGALYTKGLKEMVACPGGLATVKVPPSMRSIRKGSLWWTDILQQFVVDELNANYRAMNGLLLTKDGSRLVAGLNGRVVIPPCVSAIDAHAFHGYRGLTSVTIPPTVKNIGRDAFYACHGLNKVVVGKGDVERVKGMLCVGQFAPKVDKIQFEEADL